MKKITAVVLFMILTNGIYAQNNKFEKIASFLKQELVDKPFIGGIYEGGCDNIDDISISEKGEILITGKGKVCNKTLFIKDAVISVEKMKVSIFQPDPRIDIIFYSEKANAIFKVLMELKEKLNN